MTRNPAADEVEETSDLLVSDCVRSVVFSPDGQFVLCAGHFFKLRMWEVATATWCPQRFVGPTHCVRFTSAAISLNGRFALSGSGRGVWLWEAATGQRLRAFEGHTDDVTSVALSADGSFALSGSLDCTVRLWELDWHYEAVAPAGWDEGARPLLENFLVLQTPYAASLPAGRAPTDEEVSLALTRRGHPVWTDGDFDRLLVTLAHAGYGWLRPEGVRDVLNVMARTMGGARTRQGGWAEQEAERGATPRRNDDRAPGQQAECGQPPGLEAEACPAEELTMRQHSGFPQEPLLSAQRAGREGPQNRPTEVRPQAAAQQRRGREAEQRRRGEEEVPKRSWRDRIVKWFGDKGRRK
jgi:hypothetical protein